MKTCDPSVLAEKIEVLEKAEVKRKKFWKTFWDASAFIMGCGWTLYGLYRWLA